MLLVVVFIERRRFINEFEESCLLEFEGPWRFVIVFHQVGCPLVLTVWWAVKGVRWGLFWGYVREVIRGFCTRIEKIEKKIHIFPFLFLSKKDQISSVFTFRNLPLKYILSWLVSNRAWQSPWFCAATPVLKWHLDGASHNTGTSKQQNNQRLSCPKSKQGVPQPLPRFSTRPRTPWRPWKGCPFYKVPRSVSIGYFLKKKKFNC